ncbi:nucleoside hydrolase [Solimonas marina]|uniref:Nucleoside hydrolase n=1 Tax=Solimonas marina TaxID=2714601 RepID=A0A970B807_9GAMM|nr:nucleoside hydrolase [Solimonas marina]NKF24230.1 nucleoside hydrolase [Solimonas marina]
MRATGTKRWIGGCGAAVLSLLVLLTLTVHTAQAADGKRLVILDDDLDGFHPAQLMALQAPDVDVLGITIVSGNAWRDEEVAHALRMLEIVGRTDIPVVPGATYPLLNSEKLTERWEALYGKLVWKGAWMKKWVEDTQQSPPHYHGPDVVPDLPEGNPTTRPSAEIAANFLIRKVHEFPGQVSIVATGPLTNLALAQRLDPQFASLAKELVYMGGSLNPRQRLDSVSAQQFAREFVNSPRREFNMRFDPEAASIVLRAPWKKIVMVPSDPSTATELTPALLKRMTAADTPLTRQLKHNEPGFPLWDELAVAVWLDPTLIAQSASLYVDVDTQFGPGYGDTLSWSPGYEPDLGEQRETVVRDVDVKGVYALMVRLMNRPLAPADGSSTR